MSNEAYDLIHVLIMFLTVVLLMVFHKEAYLITKYKKLSGLYLPLRLGLVISFLTCLFMLSKGGLFPLDLSWFGFHLL